MSSNNQWGLLRWERLGASPASSPVVVSYFTDKYYLRDAYELVRSCIQHGLDYSVDQVPDLKSWESNTGHKPRYLMAKAEQFPDRPIVWVDADARFRARPVLLDGFGAGDPDVPLAAHVWRRGPSTREMLSGTVYLGATPQRMGILRAWVQEVSRSRYETDQACLRKIADGIVGFVEIPSNYCWIFDLMALQNMRLRAPDPLEAPDVVIEHLQSSRWAPSRRGAQQ